MPSRLGVVQRTLLVAAIAIPFTGCSAISTYVHQGFKVGPNYQRPPAAVAPQWIDCHDKRLKEEADVDISQWWKVLGDPTLDTLICNAYKQNLTLKQAGFRILQSRALLGISVGELFPQNQSASGAYTRSANSFDPGLTPTRRYFDNWNWRFNLAWELDFWGRFRRAVIAAQDDLEASCADYDQVMVTLFGDVASNYVTVRTLQNQIKVTKENVKIQRDVLVFIEKRYKAGFRVTELDYDQQKSSLAQTEAAIPQFEVALRNATNRLCVLMGMPPEDLTKIIGTGEIPVAPVDICIGLPAELLRRRPDVRRAERLAAAQCEQIGIATADFYPAFSIGGNIGMQAKNFSQLFNSSAFTGSVGPSFNWRLLEYGRLLNNVRFQDARFQELVTAYQQTVLVANEEAEDGIVRFLRAQERAKWLDDSVESAQRAVKIVVFQYEQGSVDFNRYAVIQQNLITQQLTSVGAHGEIAQGLIDIYRALGGGWEVRLTGGPVPGEPKPPVVPGDQAEQIPTPTPKPPVADPPKAEDDDAPKVEGEVQPGADLLPAAKASAPEKAPADVSDVFTPKETAPAAAADAAKPSGVPSSAAGPAPLDMLELPEPAANKPLPLDKLEPKTTPPSLPKPSPKPTLKTSKTPPAKVPKEIRFGIQETADKEAAG